MSSDYATPGGFGYDGTKKLCARIDISTAKQVNDVNLDDEITIVLKGNVKRLDGPEQYKTTEYAGNGKKDKEVKRLMPGTIELEIDSMTISSAGEYDGMMDEE